MTNIYLKVKVWLLLALLIKLLHHNVNYEVNVFVVSLKRFNSSLSMKKKQIKYWLEFLGTLKAFFLTIYFEGLK